MTQMSQTYPPGQTRDGAQPPRERAQDKPSTTDQTEPCPAPEDCTELAKLAGRSLDALLDLAKLEPGDIVVIGCSTSEIGGSHIGSAGSPALAAVLLRELRAVADHHHIDLAIQCCEHLNRALVVERATMRRHNLSQVTVWPVWNAGGSLAATAMTTFTDPVVVETVSAGAGMDMGHTLIGMHLRPVAVPVRLSWKMVGHADLVLARTRPKLVGGVRACYSPECAAERRRQAADQSAPGGAS